MGFFDSIKAFLLKYAAIIAVSITFAIIITSLVLKLIRKVKEIKKSRIIEKHNAKIMAKRIFEPDSKYGREERRYYFDFVLENGERVEFPVNRDIYESTEEGTEGILVFKGGKCISFDFDK